MNQHRLAPRRSASGSPGPLPRWPRALAFAALSLALLASSSLSCRKERRPDEQIRETISLAAALAERHDVNALLALTAKGFEAEPGGLGAAETRFVLQRAFARYGEFQVIHPRASVELGEDKRSARCRVPFVIHVKGKAMPGLETLPKDPAGWLEEARGFADPYGLELRWRLVGDEWRVERAEIVSSRGLDSFF